jgi:hypothetical protein
MNDVDRDRVERVAEKSREREHANPTKVPRIALLPKPSNDVFPERFRLDRKMILRIQAIDVWLVGTKNRDLMGDFIELIQVEPKHKNPIRELMYPRLQAAMHHRALVETRIHRSAM